jgi:hypothetical protein
MKTQRYDIIGDIHGQHDKLTALLAKLGYLPFGHGFRHPDGRKVIFLGDYIDRGPKVREVLLTVRTMVETGDALAIMGNHEYNAVLAHTPDGAGGWLRQRRPENDGGFHVTLAQFDARKAEWIEWVDWMTRLPMFLDLGNLRVVHACWDAERIDFLKGKSLLDGDFLRASVRHKTAEHRAVENVLKGPEMDMPEGYLYHDKEGTARTKVRVRWWDVPEQARVTHLTMPEPFDVPGDADPRELRQVPNYGADEPPVIFGHYWMPAATVKAPLRHNIACLDFSAAKDGPLVAYQWNGERHLLRENFVTTTLSCHPFYDTENCPRRPLPFQVCHLLTIGAVSEALASL